jgi:hypothetical protein
MAKYRKCANAFEFAADLDKAAQVLGIESARDAAVTIALKIDALTVPATPRKTGRAQANWFLAEGAPRIETTESTTPEPRPKLTGKSVIYLTNSLPYIVPLEYGHSGQAPNGMLRKAIAQVAAEVGGMA